MVAINAKFNGKVFVPDEPVNLPLGQRVVMFVQGEQARVGTPPGTRGADLLDLAGTLSPEAAIEMSAAIADGCETVDTDGW